MRAIDFRLRPPYRTYLNSFMYDMPALEKSHAMRDLGPVSEAALRKNTALLVEEMDKAGVSWGVAPVRLPQNGNNDDAVTLMQDFPGHFLGVPWIDPLIPDAACAAVENYCVNGPCRAVIMEPGLYTTPVKWYVNNPDIFPVYDYCAEKNVPVLLSFGGRVSDPRYYAPELIYDIASRFRSLKLVLCHGGWPYVTAICKVAMDCPNVMLSPDTWAMSFAPGGADYILAANYTLQDQMVFGSSYPAIPLEKAVENYVSRLRPEVVDKVMYLNGARLFGLEA
ncbi:amidohydrolase family protein [uncultured Mailhella sp.]|uniref:amidohydrolase family protein n=1 Tax=uncultured Mailhella sp. TaxID=1981031 RepID=UPI0025E4B9FE|nr:amidohydrolase family protein [uncultured Mailhella sp.]